METRDDNIGTMVKVNFVRNVDKMLYNEKNGAYVF